MSEQTVARVPAPGTHQVRHVIGLSVELWRGAMFLKAAAYNYMRDRKNPFANGLLYLVIIGVIVGIIAIGSGHSLRGQPHVRVPQEHGAGAFAGDAFLPEWDARLSPEL